MNLKPKSFKGKTIDFTAPEFTGDAKIETLPAAQLHGQIFSCWHVGFFAALKLLFTRTLWIGILSDGQPPMFMTTKRPFKMEDAQAVINYNHEREEFKKRLNTKYGTEAAQKVERLIKGGIKKGDPRWNFCIERDEYEKCLDYKIGFLMGLKLLRKDATAKA